MRICTLMALGLACLTFTASADDTASESGAELYRRYKHAKLEILIEHDLKLTRMALEIELEGLEEVDDNDSAPSQKKLEAIKNHQAAIAEQISAIRQELVEVEDELKSAAADKKKEASHIIHFSPDGAVIPPEPHQLSFQRRLNTILERAQAGQPEQIALPSQPSPEERAILEEVRRQNEGTKPKAAAKGHEEHQGEAAGQPPDEVENLKVRLQSLKARLKVLEAGESRLRNRDEDTEQHPRLGTIREQIGLVKRQKADVEARLEALSRSEKTEE